MVHGSPDHFVFHHHDSSKRRQLHMLSLPFCLQQPPRQNYIWDNEHRGPNSVRWVHILVLVEIVVEIVERLLTLVSVKVDGVGRYVGGLKCAGNQWHELAKYADAAMPESRLR